ncbi:MAG: hypothetical protein E6I29_10650 [Chloroflexi bacterium]|nr:MAG: hypothetical protein E6I29_10650 [Chloroflexota bacterium]
MKLRVEAPDGTPAPDGGQNPEHRERDNASDHDDYRITAETKSDQATERPGDRRHDQRKHPWQRLQAVEQRSETISAGGVDAQGLEGARQIVVRARDEVRLELWMELEIRAPQAIHPEHPSEVVAVERREPGDRENAHQQNDREHEDGDGDETC